MESVLDSIAAQRLFRRQDHLQIRLPVHPSHVIPVTRRVTVPDVLSFIVAGAWQNSSRTSELKNVNSLEVFIRGTLL